MEAEFVSWWVYFLLSPHTLAEKSPSPFLAECWPYTFEFRPAKSIPRHVIGRRIDLRYQIRAITGHFGWKITIIGCFRPFLLFRPHTLIFQLRIFGPGHKLRRRIYDNKSEFQSYVSETNGHFRQFSGILNPSECIRWYFDVHTRAQNWAENRSVASNQSSDNSILRISTIFCHFKRFTQRWTYMRIFGIKTMHQESKLDSICFDIL